MTLREEKCAPAPSVYNFFFGCIFRGMKIRISEVRALIREQLVEEQLRSYVRFILEGFAQDKEFLVSNNPESQRALESLDPKAVSWLTARFGQNPKIKEIHPLEDSIPTLKTYLSKASSLNQQYKTNEKFRKSVEENFPKEERKWNTPAEHQMMSVDDMEKIMFLSVSRKSTVDVGTKAGSYELPEGDRVGKVGPWNVWQPSTESNSCKIAGYDPKTLEPKTTWCTARTTGQNLFDRYVDKSQQKFDDLEDDDEESPNADLFYIIKDDPREDMDWISIGFRKGKIDMSGGDGGLTVNRANKGMDKNSLKRVFGNHFNAIIKMVKNRLSTHQAEIETLNLDFLSKNPSALFDTLKRKSKDRAAILYPLLSNKEVGPEILDFVVNDPDPQIRSLALGQKSLSDEQLKKLSEDDSSGVRIAVARLPHLPKEVFDSLIRDEETSRIIAMNNKDLTDEVIARFVASKNPELRRAIAMRENLDDEQIRTLASDVDTEVRNTVARNPRTSKKILDDLSRDEAAEVRESVAGSKKVSPKTLVDLHEDPDDGVRHAVALNKATPKEVLLKMSQQDPDKTVRSFAEYMLSKLKA